MRVPMGLRAIALDLGAHKLQQCLDAGAEHFVDASGASDTLVGSYTQPVPTPRSGPEMDTRAAAVVEEVLDYTGGGAHGVLCLAPKRAAFELATSISRRRGRVACIGLPPGGFPNPMFEVALKRVAVIRLYSGFSPRPTGGAGLRGSRSGALYRSETASGGLE